MKYFLPFPLLLFTNVLFAQNKDAAERAVARGVKFHDKHDYYAALKRYDSALALDKDNLMALAEKAYTLLALDKYDESIECCKTALKKHPNEDGLKMLYVTYGTDYDYKDKTDKAIEIYDEGIKQFPGFYLLYFNKGISLSGEKKYADAEPCFEKSLMLDPDHAGSNNALGRINYTQNKKIPALLALSRFLVLEPQSNRTKDDLGYLQKIMGGNVEKNGTGGITIYVSESSLKDSNNKENNFSAVELMLSLSVAASMDSVKLTKISGFAYQFSLICSTLSELKDKNSGFYWEYYVPYFAEMKEKNFIETFSHLIFASDDDKENSEWLFKHKKDIVDFYNWSKGFTWKQN